MYNLNTLTCVALSSSLLALPAAVKAERKPATLALEEIIITAQKREQTLRDVPGSVVAISEQSLERTVSTSFLDLSAQAPGVEIVGTNDGFGKSIRVRGIGTNSFVSSVPPSVGVFIDDIPLVSLESAFNNLVDVERVEVLKGPQSTLFGKSVSSGLIDISTKRPHTDDTEGFAEVNIGNLGQQEYRLGGNIPLTDTAAVRVSLYDTSKDGGIKNTVSGKGSGETESQGGRLRLLWEPSDTLSAVLGYETHDTDSAGTRVQALEYGDFFSTIALLDPNVTLNPAELGDRKNQDSIEGLRTSTTDISSLHIDWELSDSWSFHSVTSYQEWLQSTTKGKLHPDAGFASGVGPTAVNPGTTLFENESLTQEWRLNFDGDSLSSVFGLFASRSDYHSDTHLARAVAVLPANTFAPGLPADLTVLSLAIVAESEREVSDFGIFMHNIWEVSDSTELTFGLRYSEVETEDNISNKLGLGSFADQHGLPGVLAFPVSLWSAPVLEQSWEAVTGGIKISYAATDNMNIYGSYDRGFKPGGFTATNHDQSDVTGNGFLQGESFDEETADALEIGLKGMFFDDSVAWNAAIYYQVYNDYQVSIIDPVTVTASIDNAGEVISQGFETDIQWLASEQLMIAGNLSYVDSRYEKYEGASCVRPQYSTVACTGANATQDLSGSRVNTVSPWTASVNSTWSDTFANGLEWYLRGEILFRDDRIYGSDLDPATRAGSYYLLNASFGITADSGWETILWVKNLGDEDYFTEIKANTDGRSVQGLRGEQGFERTYGIKLKYTF